MSPNKTPTPLNSEELSALKQAFSLYDRNNDGAIASEEFAEILKSLGIASQKDQIQSIILAVDSNKDGLIDFDEFVVAMTRHMPPEEVKGGPLSRSIANSRSSTMREPSFHEEDELKEVFKAFDKNQDGMISYDELEEVMTKLGEKLSASDIKNMMDDADINKDGFIDFEEFKNMMPKDEAQ
ncbi:calmodulin [Phycomyces blakesleeanus]|uniref:Calmodulin n=2 Tax=Phycomyces blakesleeanus TaxID=4837 RepID=A0A162UFL4_PHYB8|nr:calmodulin [Phycomyces blakesleeanus NRRL 1555(-)]OAD75852.1 calmodulin [Phycomyces blakesleeanus NRRL 1555(-)]|eukprot:XP_018293892.1 calmodulin [Phycomyces blakesleeanus NRRL 1555(-)]